MSGDETRLQGKRAEAAVEFMADRYRQAGVATIWRQGTIAIPTRGGWKPINSLPDFGGVIHGKGRAVAFDVKSTTKPTYRHSKTRAHQLEHLWKVHEAGGLAGLLIEYIGETGASMRHGYFDSVWYWLWPTKAWEYGDSMSIKLEINALPPALGLSVPFYEPVSEPYPDFLHLVIQNYWRYYTR